MKFWVKSTAIIVTLITLFTIVFTIEVGGYKKYLDKARYYALKEKVELSLVLAVMKTESNFNKNAVSNKGAIGLMQLMPQTAKYISLKLGYQGEIDLFSIDTNIYLGVLYLKYLSEKFLSLEQVLWAYNAGEGRVKKWLSDGLNSPPYKETKNYKIKVMRRKRLYEVLT